MFHFIIRKKACPVCKRSVVNLPRHLMVIRELCSCVGQFGIRGEKQKQNGIKKAKWKSYHRKRICPLTNCMKVVVHLSEHLHGFHKMKQNQSYYHLLDNADFFCTDVMQTQIINSPRKNYALVKRRANFFQKKYS